MASATKMMQFFPFATARRSRSSRAAAKTRRSRAFYAMTAGFLFYATFHVALVVTSEFSNRLRDPLYGDREAQLRTLEDSQPPGSPVVLFIGTSRTSNGFDAGLAQELLTAELDRPVAVFNWGIPASGSVTQLIHLKRLVKDRHRPTLLLVEVFPAFIASNQLGNIDLNGLDGSRFLWSELDWLDEYYYPTDQLRQERQSVLIAPWYVLRNQIMARTLPSTLPFHAQLRYNCFQKSDKYGWSPIQVVLLNDEQLAQGFSRTKEAFLQLPNSQTLDDGPVKALHEILTVASQEKIPTILVRMPEGKNFQTLYHPAFIANFERLVNELVARYGCGFCDAHQWNPDNNFVDGFHLVIGGAEFFSEKLARDMIEPSLKTLKMITR